MIHFGCRDSAVGKVTCYGLNVSGFRTRWEQEIVGHLFTSLGFTKPSVTTWRWRRSRPLKRRGILTPWCGCVSRTSDWTEHLIEQNVSSPHQSGTVWVPTHQSPAQWLPAAKRPENDVNISLPSNTMDISRFSLLLLLCTCVAYYGATFTFMTNLTTLSSAKIITLNNKNE
jgi:hypothetical protein